jgi:hypothetical protein
MIPTRGQKNRDCSPSSKDLGYESHVQRGTMYGERRIKTPRSCSQMKIWAAKVRPLVELEWGGVQKRQCQAFHIDRDAWNLPNYRGSFGWIHHVLMRTWWSR